MLQGESGVLHLERVGPYHAAINPCSATRTCQRHRYRTGLVRCCGYWVHIQWPVCGLTALLEGTREKDGVLGGSEHVKDQRLPLELEMSDHPVLNWYPLGLDEWT